MTVGVAVFDTEAQATKVKATADKKSIVESLSGGGVPTFCRAAICRSTTNSYGRYAYFTIAGFTNGKDVTTKSTPVFTTGDDLAEFAFRQIRRRGEAQASAASQSTPPYDPMADDHGSSAISAAPAPRVHLPRTRRACKLPPGQQLVRRVADLLQGQPVRPYDMHGRVPHPAASTFAGPVARPGARRPRTAARRPATAPCCGRRRRPGRSTSMMPSAAGAPRLSRGASRIVVAPSRFLQYAAKSCSPRSGSAAAFMASTSNGQSCHSTWPRSSGSTPPGRSPTR